MKSSTLVIGFTLALLFLCLVLGVLTYVPEREIKAGFESVFITFKWSAIGLAIAFSVAGLALILAGGCAALTWALTRGVLGWRMGRANVARVEAEAVKAKRESELILTVAPPGSPVIATSYQAGQITHNPLHYLAPDPQSWQLFNIMQSISRRPGERMLPEPQIIEAEPPLLPDRVDLIDYLRQPSLRSIFLGLAVSGHQITEVRAPIWQLVHIANGGATDSGKSNMERAIAYQVSLADNVQTIFVDLKRQTFKPFYNSDRLLYPIIKDVQDFTACLGELRGETERRLRLFEKELTLETIHDYNRVTPEPLPYIVMFVDEMSNLFTHKDAHNQFLELIRISRAAGIYIVAAGQSWSHRTLSPDTRQQFRTAFHFATNDAYSSRMLLNDGRATSIEVQGRAFASLPFGLAKDVIEVQTPYLDLQTVAETLGGNGKSILDLPVRVVNEGEPGESANDMFVRLVRGGTKRTEASLIAFKKVYSGNHVTYCKRLLGEV